MKSLSIHALEGAVEKRVRDKARRDGKSMNQTLKELLAVSLGMAPGPAPDRRSDFAEFNGIWTERQAAEFNAATADLEKTDKADWT